MPKIYSKKTVAIKAIALIFAILLIDQIVKIYVKTHFTLHESVTVFSWFKITFVENTGMAFGLDFGGKLFLTLFRIAAVCLLAWFIAKLIKSRARQGFILTVALVLAGAAGNIIDSVFYGLIFDKGIINQYELYQGVAAFAKQGYAPLFHGSVVDMLSFPIITSGEKILFFSPVFNIADSAITIAIFLIIIFFRKDLNAALESKKNN